MAVAPSRPSGRGESNPPPGAGRCRAALSPVPPAMKRQHLGHLDALGEGCGRREERLASSASSATRALLHAPGRARRTRRRGAASAPSGSASRPAPWTPSRRARPETTLLALEKLDVLAALYGKARLVGRSRPRSARGAGRPCGWRPSTSSSSPSQLRSYPCCTSWPPPRRPPRRLLADATRGSRSAASRSRAPTRTCRRRRAAGPTRRESRDLAELPTAGLAQQCGALASNADRSRPRQAGVEQAECVVEQTRRPSGPPLEIVARSSGEKTIRYGRGQLLAAGDGLAVHPCAAPTGGEESRLRRECGAVRVVDLGPGDRALGAGPAPSPQAGGAPEGTPGPRGPRLASSTVLVFTGSSVGPRYDRRPLRHRLDVGGAEDAEDRPARRCRMLTATAARSRRPAPA